MKVDGHPGLVRDKKTGAIININSSEIEQARALKIMRRDKSREHDMMKRDIESLKDGMAEITVLLHQLIEKK